MNRRDFLAKGSLIFVGASVYGCQAFGVSGHRYKLAPESILPEGLRDAPNEIRESYRFAAANREIL
jgi:hypothetical protein